MSSKIESIEVRMQRIIKDAAMDVEDLQQVPGSGECRRVVLISSQKNEDKIRKSALWKEKTSSKTSFLASMLVFGECKRVTFPNLDYLGS